MSGFNYDDLNAAFMDIWDQHAGLLESVSLLDIDDATRNELMAEVNKGFDELENLRTQYALDVEVA